jgi:Protein kinase domain
LLDPGTIVAGYRIDGVLGVGGMGVVYRSTQLSLNRVAALKVLASEFSDDPAFRERFRREGQLQAAIDHPHIVTVYEAGQTEHGLFLAMRVVKGPTLKDLIIARELEAGRALRVLTQVADALDAAHDVGLIHRDVKPQNILLDTRDNAYLADFGLTKAPGESGLTEEGQFVGTIDYVSPEQARGQPATNASDVYALAGVLCECLTGEVPFPRSAEAAVLFAHLTEPPPRLSEQRPDLPAALDDVVARGMAKDPGARPASATELMADAARAYPAAAAASAATTTARTRPRATSDATSGGRGAATAQAAVIGAGATRAAVTRAAPAAPPARRPAVALVGVGAVLLVLAVVGGVLAGRSGSETSSPSLSQSASAGSLLLSFPGGWERLAAAPKIPGITFSDPFALAPAGGKDGQLVAGTVDAAGPTLLPATLLARLDKTPAPNDPVRLGALQAYRYKALRPKGVNGTLTVYATPTTDGVATVACVVPPGTKSSFLTDCERVAATLRLAGAKPYSLGPSAAYADSLGRTTTRLNDASAPAARRLQGADTPDAQASAAADLAAAYRDASRRLARLSVSPVVQGANSQISAALAQIARGYDSAASAARDGDTGGYTAAGRTVSRGGAALGRAFDDLKALGYTLQS